MNTVKRIVSASGVQAMGGLINGKLPLVPDDIYLSSKNYVEVSNKPLVNINAYEVTYADVDELTTPIGYEGE